MTAADPIVRVPLADLSPEYIGTELLVLHPDRPCVHRGGLSDIAAAYNSAGSPVAAVLFLGGELVVVADGDVILTSPTPTAIEAGAS